MDRILVVGIGGAVGSILRYVVGVGVQGLVGPGFPWGTLVVNVLGSFLIGAVLQFALNTTLVPPLLRLALVTGVMGGFTTYSTFNEDTLLAMADGHWLLAASNVVATVLGCLAAGVTGAASGRALAGLV